MKTRAQVHPAYHSQNNTENIASDIVWKKERKKERRGKAPKYLYVLTRNCNDDISNTGDEVEDYPHGFCQR